MKQVKEEKKDVRGILRVLPIQLILVVLPLLIRYYRLESDFFAYAWYGNNDVYYDTFLHFKMLCFSGFSAFLLVLVIWEAVCRFRRKEKLFHPAMIPVVIYVVGVILSTVNSINLEYSLNSTQDSKEPVWVLLGYAITLTYAVLFIKTREDVSKVLSAGVVGAGIMSFIGVLQALGWNPVLWEPMQHIYVGKEMIEQYGYLGSRVGDTVAYGTLYNQNYVGSYVALYLPLALGGIVVFKKLWSKILSAVVAVGLVIFLFASQSRTGIIAVVVALMFGLLCMLRRVIHKWYMAVIPVVLLVTMFIGFDFYSGHTLSGRLLAMFSIEETPHDLHWIDTTGRGVKVGYKNTEFTVKMDWEWNGYSYTVLEKGKEKEVHYAPDSSYAYFYLNSRECITIQTARFEDQHAFGLNLDGNDYYFYRSEIDGNYRYINYFHRVDECIKANSVFEGYESVASGRGYVWGCSIPLLKDYLLYGSGPDTFTIAFPQNDYVARNNGNLGSIYFTRPHNFYLQIGVQTGVMSLVAFLAFYLYYFISSCRRYFWKPLTSKEQWIGFALFLSTIGFLVAGLANDSLVTVTPMFYVLLGTGVAVNARFCPVVKKQKQNKSEEISATDSAPAEIAAEA